MITVESSPSDFSVYGQPVTFTAKVSPQYANGPTGTVTFKDGNGPFTFTASLDGGTATVITFSLPVGFSPIQAIYSGDNNFTGSTSPVPASLFVKPAPLIVTADPKTKTYGSADPALTYTYTGLVNGDTSALLHRQPHPSRR